MAQRKRRRFSSEPAVHRETARTSALGARWWLKEMRRQVRMGNCHGALDSLTTANRMSAVATTERRGAGMRGAMYQATTLRNAMKRFAAKCMR